MCGIGLVAVNLFASQMLLNVPCARYRDLVKCIVNKQDDDCAGNMHAEQSIKVARELRPELEGGGQGASMAMVSSQAAHQIHQNWIRLDEKESVK